MSLRSSLTVLSALTLLAIVPACGSDESGSSPGDAASEGAANDAETNLGADASPDSAHPLTDGAIDAKGNPNNVGPDATADAAEQAAADGGGADATMDSGNDVTADGTVGSQKDAANDVVVDSAADATGDVANDVIVEAAADVVADVARDVAIDAPVDGKVLDAFPDTGFVIPDASNDSGGSTAACETCAVQDCGSQVLACIADPKCQGAELTLTSCLENVASDGGMTLEGCLMDLADAGTSTVDLGTCLVTSCSTACGVPPGFDAGP